MSMSDDNPDLHLISVVIPVFRGASTLPSLVRELASLTTSSRTPAGFLFAVAEVLLVYDHGPDESDVVIRSLANEFSFVHPVWLSRNFGQHAATLAGMASSASEWIATIDEDGQHDPEALGQLLDAALEAQADVVYASPTNAPPHGKFRNATSSLAKWASIRFLSSEPRPPFHSYRLLVGEIGRSVAAYAGSGIYLDVGLGWVTQRFATCPVAMRVEGRRRSSYSTRTLLSHFWRLVLTSGTRPMRAVSLIGGVFAGLGFLGALVVLFGRLAGRIEVEGWTSLTMVVLVGFGLVLLSLGIVSEYLGIATRMAMGKPPFLVVGDKENGPLAKGSKDR